ncbi:MAG: diguanylate cyclase, partial [Burkholderiaceae bacterium]|nr:diguanylate cyclase [Burkholderiaceae bacterium]
MFRYLPDMVHLKDGDGRWLLTNPAARATLGLSEREASGFTNLELADQGHPSREGLRHSALNEEATWQSGRVSHGEEVVSDGRGGTRVFDVVRVPSFGRQGQRLHMLVLRRDVTDQRTAATKLELAGRVLDQSTDGMLIANADNQIMLVNAAFTDITGYTAEDVLGKDTRILSLGADDNVFSAEMLQTLAVHGRWTGEVWSRRKNGEVYPQWLNLTVLRHRTSGEVTHYVGALTDLSSSKAAEEKIAYLSTQDVVTGLPNRTQAALRASMALGHGQLAGQQAALMVVDIDNFKTLNDSLGHAAGDQMLREVGLRLGRAAGSHAVVGRLSGDEFMVLVPDVHGTAEAAHRARHLMEVVGERTVIGGLPISISLSVGVAMFPADGDTFDVLFALADTALYAAKRSGRAAYQ